MAATKVAGPVVLGVLISALSGAQTRRPDWPELRKSIDFANTRFVLADAPINQEERDQIYALLDSALHEAFRDEPPEGRKAILSTRVQPVALSGKGGRHFVVMGSGFYLCSPTGNCPIWVLMRAESGVKLILEAEGQALFAGAGTFRGMKDLVVPFHNSGFETSFTVYRWSGTEYKAIDCYLSTEVLDHPEKPRGVRGCSKE